MRVYLDGCFDLCHYGHFNAMRQAKALGSHLTVGIVSDTEVAKYKVPCVLTLQERCELVKSVKWVNEVIPGVSHELDEGFTQMLRLHCGISLIVNADEQYSMPSGRDPYDAPKRAGMYWAIPRTQGVSTTTIIRALLTNTSVPRNPAPLRLPPWEPKRGAVYVDGAFDCLHLGHIAFLKEARKHGAHVVVGLHSDQAVRERRGRDPVMVLEDRARAIADCRYVDGVLPASPIKLTHTFLDAIGASRVARGAVHETCLPDRDRYKAVSPRLVYILSPSNVTLGTLQRRIFEHRDRYEHKCSLAPSRIYDAPSEDSDGTTGTTTGTTSDTTSDTSSTTDTSSTPDTSDTTSDTASGTAKSS